MRTYSRKRPEYKIIEGVHDMCRLCLSKCEEGVPIFTEVNENVCATLALRIMICVGLEISREDRLPNMICVDCLTELNRYYTFRKKCEVTYQKLKCHVIAMKEQEYKATQNDQNSMSILLNNKNVLAVKQDNEEDYVVDFDKEQIVDVVNINGVSQLVGHEKVIEEAPRTPSNEVKEISATGPDISTFLTAMLMEMGIVTQQEHSLVVMDPSIRTLDLESGDGNQVTFELVEEDCETYDEAVDTSSEVVHEGPKINVTEKSDMAIQYVVSDYKEKKSTSKKPASVCDICGKRFASRSAVARHRRTHTGERPFRCGDCGRGFAQPEVMARHRLVHAVERPHRCAACGRGFTQRGALATHARTHAPPHARALELHRCVRCPKVFLYKSGLSRHMMAHNGRVYVCGACDKMFRDKSSLLRHLKNTSHAPKEPSET